ncbi:sensor histidine kinase [Novosphingobium cyanobacteriorum]|uniref:histidine kinase n=1 Tax=Novosphingobium cyanobacteriorum TaxID=3024215 RepID=A0ABT6CI16_9SPHN|nr:HAMP domain-containing sensor histidine kinase [Novosphingobium cyanobacteriorum]MDF8333562.1 HAMP domain-containing sensor histidine kinase [Novosphingobium cyanobacteriorum]
MRTRVALALLGTALVVAVPAALAGRALVDVRTEDARAAHASAALARYLRLSALGSDIERKVAEGKLESPAERTTAASAVMVEVDAIRAATRSELGIIADGDFDSPRRNEMFDEETLQQASISRVESSLIATIQGRPDEIWHEAIRFGVAGEENEIRGSQQRAIAAFQKAQLLFMGVAVAVTLAALAAFFWFRREVFAPLEALQDGTRRLGTGEPGVAVAPAGPPEFREIGESFNTMARQVSASAAEMAAANERLEAEVRSRTAQLEQANASLLRVNALRRDFLADTSHELRTPLSVLTSEIDTALRRNDTSVDALRATLGRAGRTAETMRRLVDDLLQVARAESPLLPVDCVRSDIAGLVHQCVEDFEPLFRADGGSLSVANAPPRLIGCIDPHRIAQVLRIFVDNVLKHSEGPPRAVFRIARSGDRIAISLSDEGAGIPQEDLPHLLDRFRSRDCRAGGLGIGLAIASAIADVHGGSISLESVPGTGTTVTLHLTIDGSCQTVSRQSPEIA